MPDQIKSGDDVTHLMNLKSGDDVTHLMNPPVEPQNEGFLSKAWKTANKPLVDTTKYMRSAADWYDDPMRAENRGTIRPFMAGALEGIGNTVGSMTSPLNLATMAAFGGSGQAIKYGYQGAAKGLSLLGKGLSAPFIAHGAEQVASPESTLGERGFGVAEMAGGLAGLKSKIPSIGESILGNEQNVRMNPQTGESFIGDSPNVTRIKSQMGDIVLQNGRNFRVESSITPEQQVRPQFHPEPILGETGMGNLTPDESQLVNPPDTSSFESSGSFIRPQFNPKGQTGLTGSRQNEPLIDTETGEQLNLNQSPSNNLPPTNKDIPKLLNESNDAARLASPQQKESLYAKIRNANRTLLTAYDFSAPGRQGMGLITHPEYWKSFRGMFDAWGSDKAYRMGQDAIINDKSGLFKPKEIKLINTKGEPIIDKSTGLPKTKSQPSFAEQAGLDLTDMVDKNEEIFRSKIAEKLPGVKASNRAYIAFLNKARADVFKKLIQQAGAENNLPLAKQIADSINISTGRGKLGVENSQTAMRALNEIFFAPKLMSSRVQMYSRVLNPKLYTEMNPVLRKEALRSLFGIVGTGMLVGELARLGGATISNDPTNTDFRKIKIGNTRFDPFAGLQQYGVATAKLLSGQSTSSTSGNTTDLTAGRFGQQTRADIATQFMTNKLAPIPSFVWAWMNNKEFDGQPFEVKRALMMRTVPIVMQDLYDLAKEDPNLIPAGLLPVFGVGAQTYGR